MEQYIILVFILIIICVAYLFNSYTMYQKNYAPVEIQSMQWNTYINKTNLPESLEGIKNINYINFIKQCDPKHCVINIKTGIKRCPEGNDSLVYDDRLETCTKIDTCDSSFQPYAVQEDGSVTKSNFCGKGVDCRCTQNLACPYKDLSYFNLNTDGFTGGNYNMIETLPGISASLNPGKISINPGENDYCKLNPAELTQIRNGCDLTNYIGDPINCADEDNYGMMTLYGEGGYAIIGKLKNISCQTGSTHKFPGYYAITTDQVFDIKEGIFKLINTDDPSLTILIRGIYEKINGISLINNVKSYNPVSELFDGSPVFNFDKCQQITNGNAESNINIYLVGTKGQRCTKSDNINYKNLLMCTQTGNNLCPSGVLSYNYDQEVYNENMGNKENFSRRFCQLSKIGKDYMDSPGTDTISCTIGSGCNGDDLIENQNSDKYFPDFDISGIKNLMTFSLNTDSFSKNTLDINDLVNYNPLDKFQIYKSNLTRGDIWSIININDILIYTGSPEVPVCKKLSGTSYISVNNISIFENVDFTNTATLPVATFGTCLNFPYPVTDACWGSSAGKNYIGLSVTNTPLPLNIKNSDTLSIETQKIISLAGILKEDESDKLKLVKFDGVSNPKKFTGASVNYTFIKQFGFNGFNYNTTITGPSFSGPIKFYRKNKFGMIPPYSSTINIFTNNSLQIESVVENSPFKTKFSSYYPVWNPVLQRQECIRCKPLLFSYALTNNINTEKINNNNINTNKQSITDVVIQYSGRDFKHYEYDFKKNNFVFNSVSKILLNNKEKRSTSSVIYLDKPNPNIQKGDYIIDSRLQLKTGFSAIGDIGFSTTNPSEGISVTYPGLSIYDLMGSFGINESSHDVIYYEGISLPDNNKLKLDYNSKTFTKSNTDQESSNYFFGKLYTNQGSSNGIYLTPEITVISKDITNSIITTSSPVTHYLGQKETYFQFCRLDKDYIGLSVVSSEGNILDVDVKINRITDGRITNIVANEIEKPLNTNGFTPEIKISNYTSLI